MVGIVLVSHSRPLAQATQELVQAMTGTQLPLAIAAGAGEDHAQLGTDAVEITQAIGSVMSDDGVLVLMDLGSAILSAETALDFIEEPMRSRIRLCSAPFIEGAVAAGVTAKLGSPLEQVLREAQQALAPKLQHLQGQPAPQPAAAASAPTEAAAVSAVVKIPNAHGLHARPASVFVQHGVAFDAEIRVENTTNGKGPVSATSVISLALLEAVQGHAIRISATGPQAQEAVRSLCALVESGLGDVPGAAPEPARQEAGRTQPIAAGIAIGRALIHEDRPISVPEHRADDVHAEKARLWAAVNSARESLLEQKEQSQRTAGGENAEIFAAQAMLLEDPALVQAAEDLIATDKLNAALAWHQSVKVIAAKYRELTDETLRHRAVDVEDVGRRVLEELGIKSSEELPVSSDGILIVKDLTPTQVSKLSAGKVAGVVCLDGGRTSHSAILLRALGIPSIAQARGLLGDRIERHETLELALDGATGELWINPGEEQLADLRARQQAEAQKRQRELAMAGEPAVTADGHRVRLLANVGQLADAQAASRYGAEGVGLLRTEFLFLGRSGPPDEQQQISDLRPMIEQLGGRPVVIRTMDIGGDKHVPYLGLQHEDNPFLGVRAIRISLRQPELFRTQLRALLRAGQGHHVEIMFPMISGPAELAQAREMLEMAHQELERQGIAHLWPVPTGIMVEIPSAVILADELASRCDFFSIGTNDLTQYTLAADRGNPELSEMQDALHPAILRLVQQTVEAAHRHKRPVAVCGEAAGDMQSALAFIGLGVDELSITPTAIPTVKAALRQRSIKELRDFVHEALQCKSAPEVRNLAAQRLSEHT